MFDLFAFLRQIMPPSRRTKTTLAFVQVLFAPIASLMLAMEQARFDLLSAVRGTGQVAAMEEMLNRAAFGSAIGQVYILEGNYKSVDFQVVIPPGLPLTLVGKLRALVDANKQVGKRYEVVEEVGYAKPDAVVLRWESGYPYLSATKIVFAVNQSGDHLVDLKRNGVSFFRNNVSLVAGSPASYDAPDAGATYSVSVGSLTATLTRDVAAGIVSRVGFVRNAQELHAFCQINEGDAEIKLEGAALATTEDEFATAGVWEATIDNLNYNRRRIYPNLADGNYTLIARAKGQTATVERDIVLGTPPVNRPPQVNRQIGTQTIKVGEAYSLIIPGDVFADPDGTIQSVSVGQVPVGMSPTVTGLQITIAGTPTTVSEVIVVVTATDNNGATATMSFLIRVTSNNVPPPPVDEEYTYTGQMRGGYRLSGDSGSTSFFNPVVTFVNGRVFVVDTATPPLESYERVVYRINSQMPYDSLAGKNYSPQLPILIQKYVVDTRREQIRWLDNPLKNASILIRVL